MRPATNIGVSCRGRHEWVDQKATEGI
jgi:hypothetical protein